MTKKSSIQVSVPAITSVISIMFDIYTTGIDGGLSLADPWTIKSRDIEIQTFPFGADDPLFLPSSWMPMTIVEGRLKPPYLSPMNPADRLPTHSCKAWWMISQDGPVVHCRIAISTVMVGVPSAHVEDFSYDNLP